MPKNKTRRKRKGEVKRLHELKTKLRLKWPYAPFLIIGVKGKGMSEMRLDRKKRKG
jgi:hypothetical protein